MAFEMICGQCRGNLLVEQFGVVVACPHCGAHLHIPAPADSTPTAPTPAPPQVTPPTPEPVTLSEPEPVAVVEPPSPVPMSDDRIFEHAPPTEEMSVFTGEETEPPPSVEISVVSPVAISESATENVFAETPATSDGAFSLSALMSASESAAPEPQAESVEPTVLPTEPAVPNSENPEPMVAADPIHEPVADTVTPTEMAPTGLSGFFGTEASSPPPEETVTSEEPLVAEAETSAVASAETPLEMESSPHEEHSSAIASDSAVLSAPTVTKPADKDHVTVSKSAFLMLISYSSAITLGFLYLMYYGSTNKSDYGLESLPDVVPLKKKTAGISVYKETAEMPAGHDLKVGDSQRFGNIEVTVLKVTRGEIQFRHFADATKSRLPSAPVLKLWLRFKNVSKDQEIAPLDDQLLFTRGGKDRFSYRSNQFVVRAEQKANRDAKRIIAFDHIIGSGWDLANLPLDKPLQPGESHDYYVPTCENDLDILTGELVWRVHIRKGYSSRGNGVTTLFEVHFNSDVISDEAA